MHPITLVLRLKLLVLVLWSAASPATVVVRAAAVSATSMHKRSKKHGNPLARSIRVLNQSGVKLDLFWIHPETRELAESHSGGDGIMYGSESGINSYVGHEFEVQELPSKAGMLLGRRCAQATCRTVNFTVNANEDQCAYYCSFKTSVPLS